MARTRTPSQVKWVVNEIAAVRGEIERIDVSLAYLSRRKAELQSICASLKQVAWAIVPTPLVQAPTVVHARGRYGRRGALRDWLRETLRQAYPGALDTLSLTERAIEVFDLKFVSAHARSRFQTDNLGSALRRLVEAGEIERLHDGSRRDTRTGVWRWKTENTSLEALRAKASRS